MPFNNRQSIYYSPQAESILTRRREVSVRSGEKDKYVYVELVRRGESLFQGNFLLEPHDRQEVGFDEAFQLARKV